MNRFIKKILLCGGLAFSLLVALPTHAQTQLVKLPECTKDGNCQLNDIVNTVISVVDFILGISGSIALVMFVYGGFLWVSSGGSEERVRAGKEAVRNAVVGLIIIFVSYTLITYGLSAFGISDDFNLLKGTKDTVIKADAQ